MSSWKSGSSIVNCWSGRHTYLSLTTSSKILMLNTGRPIFGDISSRAGKREYWNKVYHTTMKTNNFPTFTLHKLNLNYLPLGNSIELATRPTLLLYPVRESYFYLVNFLFLPKIWIYSCTLILFWNSAIQNIRHEVNYLITCCFLFPLYSYYGARTNHSPVPLCSQWNAIIGMVHACICGKRIQ